MIESKVLRSLLTARNDCFCRRKTKRNHPYYAYYDVYCLNDPHTDANTSDVDINLIKNKRKMKRKRNETKRNEREKLTCLAQLDFRAKRRKHKEQ